MIKETITWHFPADQMPDDDLTVLLQLENTDPTVAYHAGGAWWDVSQPHIIPDDLVVAWADMPDGVILEAAS